MNPAVVINMNYIEQAECLLDRGGSGNMNFTIVVAYRGDLSPQHLRQACAFLQAEHRMLRTALHWHGHHCAFREIAAAVPLRQLVYRGFEQWREIAREDVRQRFEDPGLPLWRVSWLRGDAEGQLLLTFHHAIADGVCGMQLVEHLFAALDQLGQGQAPRALGWDWRELPLQSLDALTDVQPELDPEPPARDDRHYQTHYVLDQLDAAATARVIAWSRLKGIKVHSALFAALLLAIRRVTQSVHPVLEANTVVNFRPYLRPALPRDVLCLTRVCVVTPVAMEAEADLEELARFLHDDLHARLAAGEHVVNLKRIANRVQEVASPQELWRRARIPANQIILTNVGQLGWDGEGRGVSVERLFFIANVEPIFDSPDNWILGAVTFKGRMELTLWYLEELVDEALALRVMAAFKQLLVAL